mgnify:CR=1 FL=1
MSDDQRFLQLGSTSKGSTAYVVKELNDKLCASLPAMNAGFAAALASPTQDDLTGKDAKYNPNGVISYTSVDVDWVAEGANGAEYLDLGLTGYGEDAAAGWALC